MDTDQTIYDMGGAASRPAQSLIGRPLTSQQASIIIKNKIWTTTDLPSVLSEICEWYASLDKTDESRLIPWWLLQFIRGQFKIPPFSNILVDLYRCLFHHGITENIKETFFVMMPIDDQIYLLDAMIRQNLYVYNPNKMDLIKDLLIYSIPLCHEHQKINRTRNYNVIITNYIFNETNTQNKSIFFEYKDMLSIMMDFLKYSKTPSFWKLLLNKGFSERFGSYFRESSVPVARFLVRNFLVYNIDINSTKILAATFPGVDVWDDMMDIIFGRTDVRLTPVQLPIVVANVKIYFQSLINRKSPYPLMGTDMHSRHSQSKYRELKSLLFQNPKELSGYIKSRLQQMPSRLSLFSDDKKMFQRVFQITDTAKCMQMIRKMRTLQMANKTKRQRMSMRHSKHIQIIDLPSLHRTMNKLKQVKMDYNVVYDFRNIDDQTIRLYEKTRKNIPSVFEFEKKYRQIIIKNTLKRDKIHIAPFTVMFDKNKQGLIYYIITYYDNEYNLPLLPSMMSHFQMITTSDFVDMYLLSLCGSAQNINKLMLLYMTNVFHQYFYTIITKQMKADISEVLEFFSGFDPKGFLKKVYDKLANSIKAREKSIKKD